MSLISTVLDFKTKIDERHVGAYAGSSAYFMFLSFFPWALLLLSLIRFTGVEQGELYVFMENVIPSGLQSYVFSIIRQLYSRTLAGASISLLVAVWTAGKSFMSLTLGMNEICRVKNNKNYLMQRVRGSFFAVAFDILIVLSLVLLVFGGFLYNLALQYVPLFAYIVRPFMTFRTVLMLGIFVLFFDLVYVTMPNRRGHFLEQLPGAVFTAIGWYVFSFGFSIYIEHSNAFNMYGSLTTIILLMFWLYFIMYIILIGAAINQWISEKKQCVS